LAQPYVLLRWSALCPPSALGRVLMECLCVAWYSLCGVRAWTAEWKKKNEPEDLSKNMNEKITCEHGNLCPAGGRRVVPAQVTRRHHVIRPTRSHKPPYETLASANPSTAIQAWSWLRSEFPEGAEFHSSESACKECIRDSAANKEELQNLKVVKAKEKVPLSRSCWLLRE
jgi:hypothetical protein